MSRFRYRHDVAIAPAPGTILPGVPLVDRDLGHLIPQQRVHDPLSTADRSDLQTVHPWVEEPSDTAEEFSFAEIAEVASDDEVEAVDSVDALFVDALLVADEFDPSQAIDDDLLAAVVRRRPRGVHPTSAAMVRPPAPERVKLMVGVLARDFERFGTPAPPVAGTRVEGKPPPASHAPAAAAPAVWGPWAAPHTASWPVIVPPWGALPRSFTSPLPEFVTHSA